jgi:UDPglucose 6-dehydrogenase
MYNICMTGTGYVGLVTGACLADFGNVVRCVDIDQAKIAALKTCEVPFYEPGLQEIVKRNVEVGRLSFSNDIKWGIESSAVVFVAVGTPMSAEGQADLSYVEMVARSVGEHLNSYKVVVVKSTVPAGTCDLVERIIRETSSAGHDFDVVSNPEFLREGSAVEDFVKPARIVLGASNERAFDVMTEIYRPLILEDTPVVRTDVKTSEMIKYASNAFLATKISYMNEIANLCEAVGADVTVVARAMGLDDRIGPKFLRAGAGYGGSCFPKDTKALVKTAERAGCDLEIVRSVISVNQRQRRRMVEKVERALGGLGGKTVALLGLAFKPDTDDLRDAPAMDMARALMEGGASVKAYDPVAMDQARPILKGVTFSPNVFEAVKQSDAAVFVTEWNEFRDLDLVKVKRLMRSPLVVDCRNIYEPARMQELGFQYVSVGRGTKEG